MDLKQIVSDMLTNRTVWNLHDDMSRLRRMAWSLRLLVNQHLWAFVGYEDRPLVPEFRSWICQLAGTFLRFRSEYFGNDFQVSNLRTPHACEKPGASQTDNWLTYFLKTFAPGDGGCVETELTGGIKMIEAVLADIPVPAPTDSGLNGALVATRDDLVAFLRAAQLAWANVAMHRAAPRPRLGAPDLPPQAPRGPQWANVHSLTKCELVSVTRVVDRFSIPHADLPEKPTLEEACTFVTSVLSAVEATSAVKTAEAGSIKRDQASQAASEESQANEVVTQLTTEEKVIRAITILKNNPGLSARAIAGMVGGISHTTLGRNTLFKAAKRLAAGEQPAHGFRTDKGGVEAIGNDDH